jgi:nitroreductase
MWVHDAAAVSQNILLAVESLGLGAVWTAAYPNKDRVAVISNVLNLPHKILPLNIIPIGYPNGEWKPKDKFKEEKIHYNRW